MACAGCAERTRKMKAILAQKLAHAKRFALLKLGLDPDAKGTEAEDAAVHAADVTEQGRPDGPAGQAEDAGAAHGDESLEPDSGRGSVP